MKETIDEKVFKLVQRLVVDAFRFARENPENNEATFNQLWNTMIDVKNSIKIIYDREYETRV